MAHGNNYTRSTLPSRWSGEGRAYSLRCFPLITPPRGVWDEQVAQTWLREQADSAVLWGARLTVRTVARLSVVCGWPMAVDVLLVLVTCTLCCWLRCALGQQVFKG